MPHDLLLSDDLLFASRIVATAKALGLELESARTASQLLALAQARPPACVLIDLHNATLEIGACVQALKTAGATAAQPFVVGFGSHVDAAALHQAREAGCDLV